MDEQWVCIPFADAEAAAAWLMEHRDVMATARMLSGTEIRRSLKIQGS